LRPSDVNQWPLRELANPIDRALVRIACLFALKRVSSIEGWEHVLPEQDPFLLVSNHSSRREAVFLPAVLMLARGGRPVRFLADWNFRLIPGVGYLYNRTGAVTLTGKDARPRVLNHLKPWFEPKTPPLQTARSHLAQGGSIGIFPEGTVNRDAERLLPGRRGAARLSLEMGVPVVPLGIRFAQRDPVSGFSDSSSSMSFHFGRPMLPSDDGCAEVSQRRVSDWHARLMAEIGLLCGKRWQRRNSSRSRNEPSAKATEQSPLDVIDTLNEGDAPCSGRPT
jgi:1-acyl-sn-glycerol-3-phosphate acyltransferase